MISKSSYVRYWKCNKSLWLHFNKSEEAKEINELMKGKAEEGNLVGELAKSYFPNTLDLATHIPTGIDMKTQLENTKEAIESKVDAIAEASFLYEDLFCAVDILKKDIDGYSIYEVKSAKEVKDYYKIDASFQRYVLEKCGLKINHIYIMHVNKEYVLHGALNVREYFKVECIDEDALVKENLKTIDTTIGEIRALLKLKDEPTKMYCKSCGDCDFNAYCTRMLPKDRVGVLSGIATGQYDYYNEGIITVSDYVNCAKYKKSKKNARREIQIKHILNNISEPYVNKEGINQFLNKMTYPIYYLDFETAENIIPVVEGFTPGEAFPFQYSLHIEYEDGRIEHREYLAESMDCTEECAKRLVEDIPLGVNIIAYNKSVESNIMKYLAKKYPMYENHLNQLADSYIDLIEPFKSGNYYNIKQGGSNSIKDVMPAIVPEMAEAYHELPLVHNGGEALTMFHTLIKSKENKDYQDMRNGMLEYCKLDTLSMVEIVKKLRELV